MNKIAEIDLEIQKKDINKVKYTSDVKYEKVPYDVKWQDILDPPLNNDSLETMGELNYLSRITSSISPEQKEIILEIDKEPKTLFYDILVERGLDFPETQFKEYYNVLYPMIMNAKNYYNRARPVQLAEILGKKINVIVTDTIHTPSYPSGHTCYGVLCYLLCSELYPNLEPEFNDAMSIVAHCREMQGVHYPSDNKASILFTKIAYERLQKVLG